MSKRCHDCRYLEVGTARFPCSSCKDFNFWQPRLPNQPSAEHRPEPVEAASDGGPSSYYDFNPGWITLNDAMEHLAVRQWKAASLHFKDIVKASFRFGAKNGTDYAYDIRKIVYSGLRILVMLKGKDETRQYLQRLLDDPQFQGGSDGPPA